MRRHHAARLPAWIIPAATLRIWHVPQLFQAAVLDDRIYNVQHVAFTCRRCCSGGPCSMRGTALIRPAVGTLDIFTTAIHTSVPSALLMLSTSVWYPSTPILRRPV